MSRPPPHRKSRTGIVGVSGELEALALAERISAALDELGTPAETLSLVLKASPVSRPSMAMLSTRNPGGEAPVGLFGWLGSVDSARMLNVPPALRRQLSAFRALAVPIASVFEQFGVVATTHVPGQEPSPESLEKIATDLALRLERKRHRALLEQLRTAYGVAEHRISIHPLEESPASTG